MPRGKSKEKLKKQGEKTRFGQPGSPDPRKATKSGCPKHSIRQSVNDLPEKSIAEINDLGTDNEPTVAQLIAAVTLKKALKGDMQAVNLAIENVNGKLPQETQLTENKSDDLQGPVIYLPANERENPA
jgi:hypothetical protein